jgi:tetratricopeptide (TPR) repeat protein
MVSSPKITRARSIWLLCTAALIAAVSMAPARAVADDAQTCRQERGDAAISACARAIASGEYQGHGLAVLLDSRAFAYRRKGDYDRALADLDEAIRLDPNDASSHNGRGAVWLAKREYDRAIDDFDAVIRLDPKDRDGVLQPRRRLDAQG